MPRYRMPRPEPETGAGNEDRHTSRVRKNAEPEFSGSRFISARLRPGAEAVGSQDPEHFVCPACESGHVNPNKYQRSWRMARLSLVKEAGGLPAGGPLLHR